MPTEPPNLARAALVLALAGVAQASNAQTDDTTPFYAGARLGLSHVALAQQGSDRQIDTVVSSGVAVGLDQRLGRQHLTLDGTLQNNHYSTHTDRNYRSYSLKTALNWQTVGDLTGVLSANLDRSLPDLNIASGVAPVSAAGAAVKTNIETDSEYQALARLGDVSRYSLEASWIFHDRKFTAEEYDRNAYRQNAASIGAYASPSGVVRLGLVARRTKGVNPKIPIGQTLILDPTDPNNPTKAQVVTVEAPNDYTRTDADFTTSWNIGGHSSLNTRISRSKSVNSQKDQVRDFDGITGSIGANWNVSQKLQLGLQVSRDTGQQSAIRNTNTNRVYTAWQLNGDYALTGKVSLNASLSRNNARNTDRSKTADNTGTSTTVDNNDATKSHHLGFRWTYSRGLSLTCQYDHIARDSSVAQNTYTSSSYGCSGLAVLY